MQYVFTQKVEYASHNIFSSVYKHQMLGWLLLAVNHRNQRGWGRRRVETASYTLSLLGFSISWKFNSSDLGLGCCLASKEEKGAEGQGRGRD